ncbi:MAG TPA: hypothetical protein VLE53_18395 [Gemmatimonadaceae bacterium]|nr:hypothetical protein [Gemmatimonadaceae bacterium]
MKTEEPERTFAESARGAADRLFRAAAECIRQRERFSRVVEVGTHDAEQQAALRVACLCDELLFESARAYEQTVTAEASHRDEDWCQKANALWHACREYERRHRNCDESSKQLGSHKLHKLRELALEYDFEASALLALKLATAAYAKTCPEAQLDKHPQTYVA